MTTMTVEQRIFDEYQCSVSNLLEKYATQGMTSKQVADQLQCGVSNVRRIARKYNIRFNQTGVAQTVSYSREFLEHTINSYNILSRVWTPSLSKKVKARQLEVETA